MSEKIHNEDELSNKLIFDLNKSNDVKDKYIKTINDLGNKILDQTFNELKKMINK